MKWTVWITLLLAFLAICVVGDFVFTRVILYGTPTSGSGCIHRLYQQNDGEIPIFGPSRARSNYALDQLGFKAFDYGLDGASFDVTDVLLQLELAKHKTGPIIIDLQIAGLSGLGNPADYVPYATDPRFRALLSAHQLMEWRYYLPGIRYFGYYDWYLKDFMKNRIQTAQNGAGRYTYEDHPIDRATFQKIARWHTTYSLGYHPNLDQDRRLLAHITAHPERLFILVYSPLHSSCYSKFENAAQFQAYQNQLRALPNVALIDWGRLDYPDDFFEDPIHLNPKGAADFSRKLGDKIREILRERNEGTEANGKAGPGASPPPIQEKNLESPGQSR